MKHSRFFTLIMRENKEKFPQLNIIMLLYQCYEMHSEAIWTEAEVGTISDSYSMHRKKIVNHDAETCLAHQWWQTEGQCEVKGQAAV